MGYKFDQEHYYEEGDFALIVQSTVFRVHSVILRLASGFFKARFSGEWANPSILLLTRHDAIYDAKGDPDSIVRRQVRECRYQMLEEEDSPEDMAALLSFVYPNFPRRVQWQGVAALWRMCDKYLADVALQEVRSFVEERYAESPLVAMMLADRYHVKTIYRQVSTMIIDELNKYAEEELFSMLSSETRERLFRCRLRLVESVTRKRNFAVCPACSTMYVHRIHDIISTYLEGSVLNALEKMVEIAEDAYKHEACASEICTSINDFLITNFNTTRPTLQSIANQPYFHIELE